MCIIYVYEHTYTYIHIYRRAHTHIHIYFLDGAGGLYLGDKVISEGLYGEVSSDHIGFLVVS